MTALEMTWFDSMPYYEAVKHLIQCNLLYYEDESFKLVVQNRSTESHVKNSH